MQTQTLRRNRRFSTALSVAATFCLVTGALLPAAASHAQAPPAPASGATGEVPYDVYGRGPYRPGVPRPGTVLGYELGAQHSTFRDQEQIITAIAAAAPERVRVVEYGKSAEGRPLRLIFVSSPENLAKLDTLREQNSKLADPRRLASRDEEQTIVRNAPVFTWISHCIHGDETASFETAMWTLYTLAASDSPAITDALSESVVILNPVYNPDGHERYVTWYNSIALGSPDGASYEKAIPWALRGRFNHYRFDMNRDKIAQSQVETRAETKVLLQWNPQVYIDQHGQPPVYFFPPNALPSNPAVDRDRVNRWTDVFGRANAGAFDTYGWPYVNREVFDFFYPGYLDAFSTLTGAIGMTYETDGGGSLARRRDDGTVSTLRDASIHHLESALTSVLTAAANREALLRDYVRYHKNTTTPTTKFRRVVISPFADAGRMARFIAHLNLLGIEIRETTAPLTSARAHHYQEPDAAVKAQTFPAGSLVIDLDQPQGHLARALLDPTTDLEPAFVREQLRRRDRNQQLNTEENKEGYEFYDITAWALPLAYNLDAFWTEDTLAVAAKSASATLPEGQVQSAQATRPVVYLFPFDRDNAATLALRLLSEGFRLSTATKPISIGGKVWPRGTFIARVSRNSLTLPERIAVLAKSLGVTVTALGSGYSSDEGLGLGSEAVIPLRRPRIVVAVDDGVSQTGYGSVWHLLDSVGIGFTSIRLRNLGTADLSRYNIVILPDGYGYASTLGKTGMSALKTWAQRGGALVGLGGGGTWFSDNDAQISTVAAVGESEAEDKDGKKDDKDKSVKPDTLPGALFKATIDPTHFLGWGYPDGKIVVPLQGDTFLKPSRTGTNVVRFPKDEKAPLTLSGFVWPGNTEKLLRGTSYVVDEPLGAGHAILFLEDPTFRALWPGLNRLFFSSIMYSTTGSEAETEIK